MEKDVISKLTKIANEENNQGRLANYLLNYQGEIMDLKIRVICDEIFVSVATATRLAKRLDLSGFNELRIYLAEEKKLRTTSQNSMKNISIEKYYNEITSSLKQTMESTIYSEVIEISQLLADYQQIDFYGVGGSNVILQDFAYKLARLGKSISVYSDTHLQYVQAINSTDKTIAFALSYSGTTEEVLNMLEIAKKNNAYTILMTHNNELKETYIDQVLLIESTDLSSRTYSITSRIAALSTLDLIYLKLIDIDFDYYQSILEKTRKQK